MQEEPVRIAGLEYDDAPAPPRQVIDSKKWKIIYPIYFNSAFSGGQGKLSS